MDAGVVVAFAGVGPVESVEGTFGTGADFEAAEPFVSGEHGVGFVLGDVAAALAFEAFDVEASAVLIPGEEFAIPVVGKMSALINAHADVGMSAAVVVGGSVAGFGPAAGAIKVPVVGVHLDGFKDELVGRRREGTVEVRTGDHVPEVAVDGVDEEEFAVLVPVVAPGIGGAVAEDLEGFAVGVKAPDATFDGNALFQGRAGLSDVARTRATAATVKPTVGSPAEAIGEVVVVVFGDGEAIEDDFGFAIGDVVLIAVGDEEELRRAHHPNAAASEFDAREHLQFVGEDLALVGFSVAIFVMENDDAVAEVEIEALAAVGVGVVLGDPHTALVIPGHRDGVLDVGFGGEDGGLESFGELK